MEYSFLYRIQQKWEELGLAVENKQMLDAVGSLIFQIGEEEDEIKFKVHSTSFLSCPLKELFKASLYTECRRCSNFIDHSPVAVMTVRISALRSVSLKPDVFRADSEVEKLCKLINDTNIWALSHHKLLLRTYYSDYLNIIKNNSKTQGNTKMV